MQGTRERGSKGLRAEGPSEGADGGEESRKCAEVVYGGAGAGWDRVEVDGGAGTVRCDEGLAGAQGQAREGRDEGFAFRTTLFPDPKGGGHVLLVNKKMQAGAGVHQGDKARIWIEPDLEEREILLPAELKRELSGERELRKWFDGLSDSMRREIGRWVTEPKARKVVRSARRDWPSA